MLLTWQHTAATQRGLRRRLGAVLARHCANLLAAAFAHWQCFELQRHKKACAVELAKRCSTSVVCARALHSWRAFMAAKATARDRESMLVAQVATAAARMTGRSVLGDAANTCAAAHPPVSEHMQARSLENADIRVQHGSKQRCLWQHTCAVHGASRAALHQQAQRMYCSRLRAVRSHLSALLSQYDAAKQQLAQHVLQSRFRFSAAFADASWAAGIARFAPAAPFVFPVLSRTAHGKRCASKP